MLLLSAAIAMFDVWRICSGAFGGKRRKRRAFRRVCAEDAEQNAHI